MGDEFLIDGMDAVDGLVTDGFVGETVDSETDPAWHTFKSKHPANIRAKQHYRLVKTIPANSSVQEVIRGIGNAGVIYNITSDDPALNTDLVISIDENEVTVPIVPAGRWDGRYSGNHMNNYVNGDLPIALGTPVRNFAVTTDFTNCETDIVLDSDGSYYFAYIELVTGDPKLRKVGAGSTTSWTITPNQTVGGAQSFGTVGDKIVLSRASFKPGDIIDKSTGAILNQTSVATMDGGKIIGASAILAYIGNMARWNLTTGVFVDNVTPGDAKRFFTVGGLIFFNRGTTLVSFDGAGAFTNIKLNFYGACTNGASLVYGRNNSADELLCVDLSGNTIWTKTAAELGITNGVPNSPENYAYDPINDKLYVNGFVATNSSQNIIRLDGTTGAIEKTIDPVGNYETTEAFTLRCDKNLRVLAMGQDTRGPTTFFDMLLFDGDGNQLGVINQSEVDAGPSISSLLGSGLCAAGFGKIYWCNGTTDPIGGVYTIG